ncbi:hypothetical protein GCM10009434_08210 [Brevundimonas olei]
MRDNLERFIAANKRSPVVSGAVIGSGGQGAHYTLANGKTFTLSADECRRTLIRWKGEQPQ